MPAPPSLPPSTAYRLPPSEIQPRIVHLLRVVLAAHAALLLLRDVASAGVAGVDLVPGEDAGLAPAPAEVDPAAFPGGGEVHQPVVEAALREADAAGDDLSLDDG